MRFVSVVTSTRSSRAVRSRIIAKKIVHLPRYGFYYNLRIDEPGRSNQLFDEVFTGTLDFEISGRRRDADDVLHVALELFESQWPIVERARQAKPEIDQRFFPRPVSAVHAVQLRNRLVRLVDDEQEILGEVVDEGRGRIPRLAPGKVPRVVLDALHEAHLLEHLEIVLSSLGEPLLFEKTTLLVEPLQPLAQLLPNRLDGMGELLTRRHVV